MKKFGYMYYIWAIVFILFPLLLVFFYSVNTGEADDFSNLAFTFENYRRFFEP